MVQEVMPLLSVIIPVYNTEKYVERCLDSVLSQSYQRLEIIVVNDCSPGNIDIIIKSFMAKDERIKYAKHKKNKGLFLARLTGADLAHGDYIAFVDSDDYITSDYYHTLLRSAETYQSDIVIGKTIFQKQNEEKYIDNLHDCCFYFDQLDGTEVQEHYFKQKGLCYSWHTIWNKIYRKKLWDCCRPYYSQISQHLIMTEDVAFSTPLFYFANKVTTVRNDGYFYCENSSASTNIEKITLNRFEKNIKDLTLSFDFCKSFLDQVNAPEKYKTAVLEFRKQYSRLWRTLGEQTFLGVKHKKVMELMECFLPGYCEYSTSDDTFFESVQTKWNGGLEHIKNQIIESSCKYVSFDIFDTVVYRPLYRPTDLFYLLDRKFEALVKCNINFHKIRISGEEEMRWKCAEINPSFQDVTIEEIYQCIGEKYGLSIEVTSAMMNEEKKLEIQLCKPRKAAKELFDLALRCGKKVIFISDMYLDEDTIRMILENCGYKGYNKMYLSSTYRMTKHRRSLYHAALEDLMVKGSQILHIGDTWENDIIGAQQCGMSTIFFPKAVEIFENKVLGIRTAECSDIAKGACGCVINSAALMESLGYRTMLAVIANYYFDNPYRSFNEQSGFNIDPYFMGYYPLGMHMLGLSKWLLDSARKDKYKTIHFLARDGYLPIKAYEVFSSYFVDSPKSEYNYASRKSLFPAMIVNDIDFYDLPVEFRNHSPKTLLGVLKFCMKDISETEVANKLKEAGILYRKTFQSEHEYRCFLAYFLQNFYSREKHQKAYETVRLYYKNWETEKDVAFDLGYSGRIQAAISRLSGHGINVFFVHSDGLRESVLERKYPFKAICFYDFTPNMTGLIREHIFSDLGGSCVGFRMDNGRSVPVLENEKKTFQDRFTVDTMQRGALDFCRDFLNIFEKYLNYLPFKCQEVSLPFEGFLRNMKDIDRRIFCASYFEDMVYGANDNINIYEFLQNQYAGLPGNGLVNYQSTVSNLLYNRGKLTKLLIYSLFDRRTLKEKVKKKLTKHPLLFQFCRKGYKGLKRLVGK